MAKQAQTLPSQASSMDYDTSALHKSKSFARNNLMRSRMPSNGLSVPFQSLATGLAYFPLLVSTTLSTQNYYLTLFALQGLIQTLDCTNLLLRRFLDRF